MMGADVTSAFLRELEPVAREHQLLVAGRAAAELHGLAFAPAVRLDLACARPVLGEDDRREIRDAVGGALTRVTGRATEIEPRADEVSLSVPADGPHIDLVVRFADVDLHADGWVTGSHVRLPDDGPTVVAVHRTDVARLAGIAWWKDPDDTRRTLELGMAADRVGLDAATRGWPPASHEERRARLASAIEKVGAARPVVLDRSREQCERGLRALLADTARGRGRTR